jgi:hypothetical protein
MRIQTAVLAAVACLLLGAAPALAQSAEDVEKAPPAAEAAPKVKAKAKKRVAPKGKHAAEVMVQNARADGITAVTLTTAKGKSIAVVKKSLPAGTKHAMKLPAGSGCDFTVSARFADGTELDPTPVNLCNDKTIRFTDGEAVTPEIQAPTADE